MRFFSATDGELERLLPMMEAFNQLEGIAFNRAATAPALARLLGDATLGAVEILELDGDTVGYAVVTWGFDLEFAGRDAYLTEIYLRPEARGRGLGKALLAHVESVARQSGARALHLGVRPENEVARSLYRAAAFQSWTRLLLSKLL